MDMHTEIFIYEITSMLPFFNIGGRSYIQNKIGIEFIISKASLHDKWHDMTTFIKFYMLESFDNIRLKQILNERNNYSEIREEIRKLRLFSCLDSEGMIG